MAHTDLAKKITEPEFHKIVNAGVSAPLGNEAMPC